MPRDIISISVLRNSSTADGAGGYTQSLVGISGSPFQGRVYRRAELSVTGYDPENAGATDVDYNVIVSLFDTQAGVQIDDIAVLPDGSHVRVVRVRQYTRSLQCDVVKGVD